MLKERNKMDNLSPQVKDLINQLKLQLCLSKTNTIGTFGVGGNTDHLVLFNAFVLEESDDDTLFQLDKLNNRILISRSILKHSKNEIRKDFDSFMKENLDNLIEYKKSLSSLKEDLNLENCISYLNEITSAPFDYILPECCIAIGNLIAADLNKYYDEASKDKDFNLDNLTIWKKNCPSKIKLIKNTEPAFSVLDNIFDNKKIEVIYKFLLFRQIGMENAIRYNVVVKYQGLFTEVFKLI